MVRRLTSSTAVAACLFVAPLVIYITHRQRRQGRTRSVHDSTRNGPIRRQSDTCRTNRSPGIARLTLDKQFHGKLEAASKGEMLAGGGTKGTGGYVAMEVVTGTLAMDATGVRATAQRHHDRTTTSRSIIVVPGLRHRGAGRDRRQDEYSHCADGKHSYDFEYTLPAK